MATRTNLALLLLRVGLGLISMFYGAQKMLGLFGGPGLHPTVLTMEHAFGIPPVITILASGAELVGGLGMLLGLLTPVSAFGFSCTMAFSCYIAWKSPNLASDLFHNGTADLATKAFYSPSLLLGGLGLMLMGAGAYSLDAKVFRPSKKKKRRKSES